MEGHCYRCAEKFGFFRKELGCKKCGHSFCKSCLPHTAVIPGRGTSPQQICLECFKFLTATPEEQKQNKQNEGRYSPPENYKKRVAAYEAKKQMGTQKGQSVPQPSGQNKRKYKDLSEVDRNLCERLDRLKEERRKMRGRVASVEEIEERLAKLKGLPTTAPSTSQPNTVYTAPDTRTSHQKTDDLMTEMKEEAAIDARVAGNDLEDDNKDFEMPSESEMKSMEDEAKKLMADAESQLKEEAEGAKKDAEMTARIAKLRGMPEGATSQSEKIGDEEISEEEATKKLITQLMEETKLEDKIGADGFGGVISQPGPGPAVASGGAIRPSADPDELPWCCICNDDATLRCRGCDDDLYCKRCFREGHDQFVLPDHETVPYRGLGNAKR